MSSRISPWEVSERRTMMLDSVSGCEVSETGSEGTGSEGAGLKKERRPGFEGGFVAGGQGLEGVVRFEITGHRIGFTNGDFEVLSVEVVNDSNVDRTHFSGVIVEDAQGSEREVCAFRKK